MQKKTALDPIKIFADYETEASLRDVFLEHLEKVLAEILTQHKIDSLSKRTKDIDSFIAKACSRGKPYKNPIQEITDITGFRIVVGYKDEANAVAETIRKRLTVDEVHSRDTSNDSAEGEFGYSSIHIIASLPQQILKQYRLEAFGTRKFEIQIRTQLEHAWAEKSRSLFYNKEVPSEHKRMMNRLAALLELTDMTFLDLKQQLQSSFTSEPEKQENCTRLSESDIREILKSGIVSGIIQDLAITGLNAYTTEREQYYPAIANILSRQNITTPEDAYREIQTFRSDIAFAAQLYMTATDMKSFSLDTLLVAALAIVDNGNVSPDDFSRGWSERWREGFLKASHEYKSRRDKG
ncbi:ppGpp synthetase catalytic domain-containing protein (RelA/SpoT-type nucleotidyltranferase) [Humidesulfovibrio mexicanus]|uniref:PpGpp synthetase catalytic domain-containing protein (RelA/SpoT-type nucleotidyltranferase) n=1 Tax=Humidesulfovibrio mexicanus TaxID=147047 RepID=A0A239AMZ3_9BACT|nr:RelA/SpoT domain-containing protein [Humidesulfovibrio mexicanus]SNR97027.1 ppGpp synthetase catalytic domain-containing protein (RelA/SpoT-type nucleotidyltranferase) [Humidesulfovibrio mexicanus]